jgi:hypothetical protein
MNEVIFYKSDRDNICETNYFDNIISILNEYLNDYSIIVTGDYVTLPDTKYKKIVLLGADENGNAGLKPYSNYNDVVAVFRFYNHKGRYDNKYIFPIPIGYNCRSNGKTMIRMYPEKPISERKYDIFYSGQTLECRKELVKQLGILSKSFNIHFQSNPSFRRGLDIDDYYRMLGDSKIVVCPDGTAVDTFRFTEACGSNCIVITTPKEDLWYYEDASVFFVDNWSILTKERIDDILSIDWSTRQQEINEYYDRCLSETAVALYIIKTILE